MERSATTASPSSTVSSGYVAWEEVSASSDRGRREVHFYLKRRGGSADLAVVGRERSLRHMSFHCALRSRSVIGLRDYALVASFKSRREVVDWLNSIVSGSSQQQLSDSGFLVRERAHNLEIDAPGDSVTMKQGPTKEIQWLGTPWTCKKRRRHFPSFCRRGVKISVHDFVYVLAEENTRLVAYLVDLYEDSKGNKMVVVRWFHKIDEVGIALPRNYNHREIFFSLCLQDLSIECIDGLATVLSPQHFEKYLNEGSGRVFEAFVCCNLFESDDVVPFDITQVGGYWDQDVVRHMYPFPPPKPPSRSPMTSPAQDVKCNGDEDAIGIRPRKKLRHFKEGALTEAHTFKECLAYKMEKQNPPKFLNVGSDVEVLSQDSGMRGCWLRASVIKTYKNKVKVRYQDILDAADEAKKLEEWILACRVAAPDELGVRIRGRSMIRPQKQSSQCELPSCVCVGTVVDVWWHDGWWEGVVVQRESDDRLRVYFPGEKRESVFPLSNLRQSQDWSENKWISIRERQDIVSAVSPQLQLKQNMDESDDSRPEVSTVNNLTPRNGESACENSSNQHLYSQDNRVNESVVIPDLSKDDFLSQLKWKASRKRSRSSGSSFQKVHFGNDCTSSLAMGFSSSAGFLIDTTFKVDHDNCKFVGNSLFGSSVPPQLTSLVMSR